MEQRIEESCRRTGHGRPVTRREFLGRGLIAGTSTVLLPSLSTMVSRAHAACEIGVDNGLIGAGKIPFLAIDQGGGANIAGSNVMVGGAGGQTDFLPMDAYQTLGLPPAISPQNVGVNTDFGIAMHPNSAMLRGMLDKTSAATRANVNGTVIPARSENDTGNNPHNPMYGIARAGANGEFVVSTGTRNSESGGRSRAPDYMISAELGPTRVSNRNEAVGLSGGEADGFPSASVATATQILAQLKLGAITEAVATEELIQCGYDKSLATFNSPILPSDLDPEADTILTNIFPGNEISNDGDFRKAAATMKVIVNGFGGVGTMEFGGRDYHQNPRPETDAKDFKIGQVIGASLEYAAALQKPLMIYTFSDGAVVADTNNPEDDGNGTTKFRWRSDNSQRAASVIFVYSPNVASAGIMRNGAASQQLGNYKPDGTIDTNSSPYANSVVSLAELVVLNYLALHGEAGNFAGALGNPTLGANPGMEHIAFNAIA
jgi:hypothetical protein